MSKNFKGYMGDQIGKLGTAVGRRWKNRMVYASYQGKVKNPRTNEQMAVRARFSTLLALSKVFASAYSKGMAHDAKGAGLTEGNMFFKKNWESVTGESAASVMVDYSTMRVSCGSLRGVTFGGVRFDEALTVKASYSANLGGYKANENDAVYIFVYAPEVDDAVLSTAGSRDDGTLSLTVPAGWNGMTVHVWGFTLGTTKGFNKGLASESTYIGNGTIS